jgi:alpha-galactosidase
MMKHTAVLACVLFFGSCSLTAADAGPANPPAWVMPEEMARKDDWVRRHLLTGAPLPFTFDFGGRGSADLLRSWKKKAVSTQLDRARTEHILTWKDEDSGLEVLCRAVDYQSYPTVEWTVYFKNAGARGTPILSEIRAVDLRVTRSGAGEFVLHHNRGDDCSPRSYEPLRTRLDPKGKWAFAPGGGRPTNGQYPYFNVEHDGGGLIVVLGWPGQWSAGFARDEGGGLSIAGGQELTHLKLLPGEEIRTPLAVLQLYRGDRIRSQNIWRRWMVAHNLPRPGGKLPPPFTSTCIGLYQSEETETKTIDLFVKNGAKLDYWWMDAGWYPTDQGWPKVGTWEPDPKRFPRGIKAVSDHAHSKGMKLVLWFEPERVVRGTWLFENHPEWLLGGGDTRLLNLGNPAARKWLTEHIDAFLTREGIDLYRQDFNIDPLGFWRGADAPDRQGLTENLHVQGYLAYWDDLSRRHPDMLIDSCASGGRRNDLETLRRAAPLLRSDYQQPANPNDSSMATGNQGHTYGLALWVPYSGTGQYPDNRYDYRSHLCPAMGIGLSPTGNWEAWHRAWEDWRRAGPNFYGDYYPLTDYSLSEDAWIAWQFHRPQDDEGMVQASRRPRAAQAERRFPLRGLDPLGAYEFESGDGAEAARWSGRALLESGLAVKLGRRESALLTYKRVAGAAALLAVDAAAGEAPLAVAFDGRESRSTAGKIIASSIDFGDGATAGGLSASHTYPAPGTYAARLTVRDEKGGTDTARVAIIVAPVDTTPPAVASAAAGRADRVTVRFSEPVARSGAESPASYAIDRGVKVESASLSEDGAEATLTVTPLAEGVSYTLSVSGIRDRARRPNAIDPGAQVSFSYTGLYARWKLDEGKGDEARDSSGSGFHGKLRGKTAWADAPGRPALRFRPDSWVETDTCLADLEFPFSISFWVNPAETQLEYADILGNHADGFRGVSIQQDRRSTNLYGFGFGDGTKWQGAGPVQLAANAWQHVAVACDGTSAAIYLDGVEKDRRPTAGRFAPNPDQPFMLGLGYTSARYFAGLLSDVRIYRRALSGKEIEGLSAKE